MNQPLIKTNFGVAIDPQKLTFLGTISILVLMASRGRITVLKRHGVKALVPIDKAA